jgi:hypothetical protein
MNTQPRQHYAHREFRREISEELAIKYAIACEVLAHYRDAHIVDVEVRHTAWAGRPAMKVRVTFTSERKDEDDAIASEVIGNSMDEILRRLRAPRATVTSLSKARQARRAVDPAEAK